MAMFIRGCEQPSYRNVSLNFLELPQDSVSFWFLFSSIFLFSILKTQGRLDNDLKLQLEKEIPPEGSVLGSFAGAFLLPEANSKSMIIYLFIS